jgi:hypothetical protein
MLIERMYSPVAVHLRSFANVGASSRVSGLAAERLTVVVARDITRTLKYTSSSSALPACYSTATIGMLLLC